jgi:hypothetical protein
LPLLDTAFAIGRRRWSSAEGGLYRLKKCYTEFYTDVDPMGMFLDDLPLYSFMYTVGPMETFYKFHPSQNYLQTDARILKTGSVKLIYAMPKKRQNLLPSSKPNYPSPNQQMWPRPAGPCSPSLCGTSPSNCSDGLARMSQPPVPQCPAGRASNGRRGERRREGGGEVSETDGWGKRRQRHTNEHTTSSKIQAITPAGFNLLWLHNFPCLR